MTKRTPKPGTYWRMIHNLDAVDVRHIERHPQPEGFDYLSLCRGRHIPNGLPADLPLYLYDQPKPIADFPVNVLGWPVMSQRMLDCLWPLIKDCVEVFPAPLYEQHPEAHVEGWYVINVIKVVDCIDVVRSVPRFFKGKVAGFREICIDPTRTEGAHLFRYVIPQTGKVDFHELICSYEVPAALPGKGFHGIAFVRCCCNEQVS